MEEGNKDAAEAPLNSHSRKTSGMAKLSHVKVMGVDSVVARTDLETANLDDSDWYPWRVKKYVYACLIALNICVQYDTGALAALMADDSEKGIASKFNLSTTEQGLLVSVAHLGVSVGCLLSGNAMQKFYAKNLLLLACVVNTITAWAFSLSPNFALLLASRILNGISQSFLIVFAPIWTDEFAPAQHKTTWLSLSEAGGPLGIVVGYLLAGLLTENADLEWRTAFYIQATLLSILTLAFIPIKVEHLQVHAISCDAAEVTGNRKCSIPSRKVSELETTDEVGIDERGQTVLVLNSPSSHSMHCMINLNQPSESPAPAQKSPTEEPSKTIPPSANTSAIPTEIQTDRTIKTPTSTVAPTTAELWWSTCTNKLVLVAAFALSSLYFVCTGLQMWVTAYLTRHDSPIKANKNAVVASFGFCAATAPVVGVIVGGIIIDKMGGYGNTRRTALLCVGYGFFAVTFSYLALAMKVFIPFIIFIWFLLFCGGAIVPGIMGIIVSAVAKSHRGVCLSFVKLTSTVLGFFGGPFAFSVVASFSGLIWGFRVVLGFTAVAELFLIITWLLCRKTDPVVDISTEEPDLVHRIRASVFATVQPSALPSPTRRASHARLQRLQFSQSSLNRILKERSDSIPLDGAGSTDRKEVLAPETTSLSKFQEIDAPYVLDNNTEDSELAVTDSTSEV